jgi:hypothetical protein
MSVTTNALTPVPVGNYDTGARWFVNNVSADFSACEELKAAVSGSNHYITKLIITTASAINVTIGAGETNSGVTATLIGPLYFTTGGPGIITLDFDYPIKVALSTSITVDASGAGATCILMQGFTV